jgi:riboflavin-specific deaminase-like protein
MVQVPSIGNISELQRHLHNVHSSKENRRPFVSVSYAQCLDGSIATKDRRPLAISGTSSMRLTHRLRSMFDGILVGINTVLADDPQLTVRLIKGPSPQPIVLDTHLRTPLDCRLAQRDDQKAWLASATGISQNRSVPLARNGIINLPCRLNGHGQIDLFDLLDQLQEKGIRSLMVEGGAKVITSFILAGLIDLFVITISPAFVGGLQVVDGHKAKTTVHMSLTDTHYEQRGKDLIVWAKPMRRN